MTISLLDLSNTSTLSLTEWAEKTNELINFTNVVSSNNTIDGRILTLNSYVAATYAQNTYVNSTFPTKIYVGSPEHAQEVLTNILTIDGPSSGLDADTVDGKHSNYFLANSTYTATDVLNKIKTVHGSGSGLDSDTVDGKHSNYFLANSTYTATDVLNKIKTVHGSGSGLDADKLDGQDSTYYLNPANLSSTVPPSKLDATLYPKNVNTATTDWNTITTAGWHPYLLGVGNANAPTNSNYYWCLVIDYAGQTISQIAFPYLADSDGMYLRTRYTGNWRPWKKVPYQDQVAMLSGATFSGSVSIPSLTVTGSTSMTGSTSTVSSGYAVVGKSTGTSGGSNGGVLGYNYNNSVYGVLGYNETASITYAFYGYGNLKVDNGQFMCGYVGNATNPSYAFTSSYSNYGMFVGSSNLKFSVAGTEVLALGSSQSTLTGALYTTNYILNNGAYYYGSDSAAILAARASGGNIYLRPNGSTTSGEVLVDSSGNILPSGQVYSQKNGQGIFYGTMLGPSSSASAIYLRPNGPGSSSGQFIVDTGGTATAQGNLISSGGYIGGTVFGGSSAGQLYFRPNGYGSGTNQATIDTSGNMSTAGYFQSGGALYSGNGYVVGNAFGWSSATSLYLRPNGWSSSTYQVQVTSAGNLIVGGNGVGGGTYGITSYSPSGGGSLLGYAPSTSYYGIVGYSSSYSFYGSGNIYTSGDITAFSDIRVKTNLEKIDFALDKIMQINGYTFNRIDMPGFEDRRFAGVIAQEVEKVLPEVVRENDDGKLSVAYGNMVGLLIEGIKDLKKENDDLREKLNKIYEKLGIE